MALRTQNQSLAHPRPAGPDGSSPHFFPSPLHLSLTPGPQTCLIPSGPRAFARAVTSTWKKPSPSPILGVSLEEHVCSPALELAPGYPLPCTVNHCLQHLHLQVSACLATPPLSPVHVTHSVSPAPSTEPGALQMTTNSLLNEPNRFHMDCAWSHLARPHGVCLALKPGSHPLGPAEGLGPGP